MSSLNFQLEGDGIRRMISRTSSQGSADRFMNNQLYQNNSSGNRMQRTFSSHQPYPIAEEDHQESDPIQERKSQLHQQVAEYQDADNYTQEATKFQNYHQMCKDIQFIEMLGNPRYISQLQIRGYFYSKQFRDYIKGLKCFLTKPQLIRLIKYPQGLYNLDLLLKKGFIESLENEFFIQRFIVDSLKRNIAIKNDGNLWRKFNMDINQTKNTNQNGMS